MNFAGFELHIVGSAMGNVLLFWLCLDWAFAALWVLFVQLSIGSERGLLMNWMNDRGK